MPRLLAATKSTISWQMGSRCNALARAARGAHGQVGGDLAAIAAVRDAVEVPAGGGAGGAQPAPLGLGEWAALLGGLEAPGEAQGRCEGAGGEVGPGV